VPGNIIISANRKMVSLKVKRISHEITQYYMDWKNPRAQFGTFNTVFFSKPQKGNSKFYLFIHAEF
jgi:hypothetical protein